MPRRPWTADDMEQARRLYTETSLSIADIVKTTRIPRTTIYKAAEQGGWQRRDDEALAARITQELLAAQEMRRRNVEKRRHDLLERTLALAESHLCEAERHNTKVARDPAARERETRFVASVLKLLQLHKQVELVLTGGSDGQEMQADDDAGSGLDAEAASRMEASYQELALRLARLPECGGDPAGASDLAEAVAETGAQGLAEPCP